MKMFAGNDRLKMRNFIRKAIIALIGILAVQLVFKIAVVPNIVLKRVKVDSDVDLSDSEILSIAGIDAGQYYYNIDADEIRKRLEDYPLVRKASVEKIFPDKLHLYLYGREAVAMAVLNVNEKSVPVAIDGDGVIFQSGQELADWDLPVITGVRFSSVELGARFPEALLPLLGDLKELKREDKTLYDLISEVRVEKRGEEGYDLVLFLQTYPFLAKVGRKLNGNILTNIIMVFDVLKQQKLMEKIGEVDFRSPEIIYRLREGV